MYRSLFSVLAALAVCFGGRAQSSLQGVMDQVLANNLTLASYRSLTRAQSLEARVGNSLENPEVEFEHTWGQPSELGKKGELTVTQQFDFPSAYVLRGRLADARAEQYENVYASVRQQILLQAQLLCMDIVALRQRIGVQSVLLSHAEGMLLIEQERQQRGDASELDVQQADMQAVAERNALRMLQVDLDEALGRLRALNGGREIVFGDTEFEIPETLPDLQTVMELWRGASPDLKAAVSEQRAAEAELRVSRSESLPKLTVGYKHEFGAGERFHGVVAGMSIPMFGNRNNVKRGKAQVEYARSAAEASLSDMQAEVVAMYGKAEALAEAVRGTERSCSSVESVASLLDKSLQAGQIGIMEYFVQLNSLQTVRSEAINFRLEYMKNYARLMAVEL